MEEERKTQAGQLRTQAEEGKRALWDPITKNNSIKICWDTERINYQNELTRITNRQPQSRVEPRVGKRENTHTYVHTWKKRERREGVLFENTPHLE